MGTFGKLLALMVLCSQMVFAEMPDPPVTGVPARDPSLDSSAVTEDTPPALKDTSKTGMGASGPSYYRGVEPYLPRLGYDAYTFMWHNQLPMKLRPFAYLRLGYSEVDNDNRYQFIGRNDGFYLDQARLGFDASLADVLTMRVSMEAASDVSAGDNTPLGDINVELRDGFVRWDPVPFIGVQAGQFTAPFDAEDLRSTADLLFIFRAIGQQGVQLSQGVQTGDGSQIGQGQQIGLSVDRQLGAMVSSHGPIPLSRFGLEDHSRYPLGIAYYFMVANGNGQNQLLNDNSDLALIGRLEAIWGNLATLGGAGLHNKRTVGIPPTQADEDDNGFDVDLLVTPFDGDLELFFQFEQIKTDFPTVGIPDRTQQAWHVQSGYKFHTPWFHITPAYRYAEFDPWASGGHDQTGLDLSSFRLDYHTFGLRIGHNELPLLFFVNYSITKEQPPNEVHNNSLQFLVQVTF